VITLRSALLEVTVDPDRGGEVVTLRRPGGHNALARYEWSAPVRASQSVSYGSATLDWLSEYRGGWQELFPNAGAECVVDGIPLPFHGEASASRWTVIRADDRSVTLEAAARLPVVVKRTMTLADDASVLSVQETVRSDAPGGAHFLWGHHPAFAAGAETVLDIPADKVVVDADVVGDVVDLMPGATGLWPMVAGAGAADAALNAVPTGPTRRLCYLPDVRAGWAAVRHLDTCQGIALAWDATTFPHVWLWEEVETSGFPWYGRSRIVAIEPQSTWPASGLAAAIASGTAHHVGEGQEVSGWLTIALFDATDAPVEAVTRDGRIRLANSAAVNTNRSVG
jgi:hypothetical protein